MLTPDFDGVVSRWTHYLCGVSLKKIYQGLSGIDIRIDNGFSWNIALKHTEIIIVDPNSNMHLIMHLWPPFAGDVPTYDYICGYPTYCFECIIFYPMTMFDHWVVNSWTVNSCPFHRWALPAMCGPWECGTQPILAPALDTEGIWGLPKMGDPPGRWMVYFMEHPMKIDDN